MADILRHCFHIPRVTKTVARMFILHFPIPLDSSCGFRGTRVAAVKGLVVKILVRGLALVNPKKEPITIETVPTAENGILGGTVTGNGVQPKFVVTEILGGTSRLGGTKTRPNGIGIIVLAGTRRNRPRAGGR